MNASSRRWDLAIWFFAFGYFATYAPYSALDKALAEGHWPGMQGPISGFALLPGSVLATFAGMLAFLGLSGWWRLAGTRRVLGVGVHLPGPWTFLSGACTAAIIMTTTLAYTFQGVSIVFMMLLMRGGVLVIAPLVDAFAGRRVRWFSWTALGLALAALLAAFAERMSFRISPGAALDVGAYLLAYFVRLRFMSRLAKSDDPGTTKRYFAEEQMVATPLLLLALGLLALWNGGPAAAKVREGFLLLGGPLKWPAFAVGLLSLGTGIFGGLILLDRRENSFCVPVNRASSVLAGVAATLALHLLAGQRLPSPFEWAGAALLVTAILVLSLPTLRPSRPPAT
ncbi:MAG: hypothetical protein HY823_02915 [Acidobacteria bacterium]|nr:hypothetical protein [Acidobacteriota bacterium]